MEISYPDLSIPFATTTQEFWADKPDDISPWSWLFHPLNRFRFGLWVAKFLNKILYYSRLKRFSFFFQRTVAKWLGISEQWLREIIRRLKLIGIIDDRKIRKNRQYRIVPHALDHEPKTTTRDETFGDFSSENAATPTMSEEYSQPPPSYSKHHVRDTRSEGSIIMDEDGNPDEIVQTFEQATGTPYKMQRDGGALAHLRQFHLQAVIAGILISRLRCPAERINSLAYCIPAVIEVIKAQATTIKNESLGKTTLHTLSDRGLAAYVDYLRAKLAQFQRE